MNNSKPIIAIKILYTIQTAIEKEILKEFFQFIGCLVKAEQVPAKTMLKKQKALPISESNQIVYLFLTKQLPEKTAQNELWCDFNISNRKLIINRETVQFSTASNGSVMQFEKEAFNAIIGSIWQNDENTKSSLLCINAAYWQFDMFAYLQIKSTFQTLKISELKALGTRNDYGLPDNSYLDEMANAFVEMEKQCGVEVQSIYSVYAYVNAQRHLRELHAALEIYSSQRAKLASVIKPVDKLLSELNKIYRVEPNFVSMYCLAAALCKGDSQHALDTRPYLRDAIEHTTKKIMPFTAETFLQYGLSERQMYADKEAAFQCFQKALKQDEAYYPAIFQIACFDAVDKRYKQAKSGFKKVILTIQGDNFNNNWHCLSLEETLYVFRSYIWLAKLALMEVGESAIGVPTVQARNAAIAFMQATILQECYNHEVYEKAKQYHENSISVRAMLAILQNMIGNSEINKELRKEIESITRNMQ